MSSEINYKRIQNLSAELTEFWGKIQAFYLDASVGLSLVRDHASAYQQRVQNYLPVEEEDFTGELTFSYEGLLSNDFCTSGIHHAKIKDVTRRNQTDGENFSTLGQLCLVSFYDFWNDYLRREYAIAKGYLSQNERNGEIIKEILRKHVKHNFWGDLRILRNSISHNRGIAGSNIAECKLIKWFHPGDYISINPEYMRGLFIAILIYRNELLREGFPPTLIKIPYR